jgi:hypothetical protein
MKIRPVLFCLLSSFILHPSAFSQGPLNPPGAPAPSMKTLDQIDAKLEKRTPINSLPFTISQPGSYYLTRNLQFTAASGNAITITVNNVTLDLMGFTLSSSSAVTGDAIRMNAGLRNIAVRNGVIAGNTTVAISGSFPNQTYTVTAAGFSNGINAFSSPAASSCHFSHLRISGCRTFGLDGGEQAVVEQVTATHNGSEGILASNGTVAHCTAFSNGGSGVLASSVTNCIANANGIFGIVALSGSVNNCTAVANGSTGVIALGGNVTNCIAKSNRNTGISASSVASCTTDSNGGTGIDASSVVNSSAGSNGLNGISAGSGSVTNCIARNNEQDGISVPSGSVTNSTALNNGRHGIVASDSVVAFCKASANNSNSLGGVDINTSPGGAARTGNRPAP